MKAKFKILFFMDKTMAVHCMFDRADILFDLPFNLIDYTNCFQPKVDWNLGFLSFAKVCSTFLNLWTDWSLFSDMSWTPSLSFPPLAFSHSILSDSRDILPSPLGAFVYIS
jgi:hypothetical protein